jgi:23S rRNA (guanine2445-N2)-methyltransferase / 23S rRNA (guanine2069-N7)-methyltransferase
VRFFATSARGIEDVLAAELEGLGARGLERARAGVGFEGPLELALRACLWSRVASRVLFPLARFPAPGPEELYRGIQTIDWSQHLSVQGTLAVDFSSSESALSHTQFGAQKVKDAIVDQFRAVAGERPSVDLARPDLRVNVFVRRDEASLAIDLSGESLHRRGWRAQAGEAPLKENLAAAILLLAGWPEVARRGGGLVDPMCGSGTLCIEAALMALDVAPGLARPRFGFEGWRAHVPEVWQRLVAEARQRDGRGREALPPIAGSDLDPRAIRAALENRERAGLREAVHFEKRELGEARPAGDEPGLFVVNPPYGERLGEIEELKILYRRIGDLLKQRFAGWDGYVFTANLELAKRLGLRVARRHVLFNGALEARLLHLPVGAASGATRVEGPSPEAASDSPESAPGCELPSPPKPAPGEAFANRLRKDFKHLSKWARREGVTCYRVYDADLPEYAVAVDLYESKVQVQEYERPDTVDAGKAERRLYDAVSAIPKVLGVRPQDVVLKVRRRQRDAGQYQKLSERREFLEVGEGGHRFLVNLRDYLDTGLFLDHREIRRTVAELAPGKRFLNLFAYTGTATVYAARAGARSTTTVDLSNTYLDWAQRNLALNGIRGPQHELVRADCLEFVARERGRFGLIFLDPPTFSRSKAMRGDFDVQRDHPQLLRAVARLLEPGGVLLFTNNFRRFKMDRGALPELRIEDITRRTLPPDFQRDPRIHNAWRITREG